MAELYSKRKWLAQAAGESALLVTSKAFEGEGAFANVVLPLLTPLLKGKDGSTLQVGPLSQGTLHYLRCRLPRVALVLTVKFFAAARKN